MNLRSQDYIAKLLAKENLTVQHGNFSTASFNVVDRVLNLPLWQDKGKDVYDLLVGHEVGHALYTPADGWHDSETQIPNVPRSMINIIEDIRIEKMIQRTYPGIVRSFKSGYKTLFDDDLFGTVGKDLTKYGFMDKLNIQSKGRGYADVQFDDQEQMFVDLAMKVETWEDVLNACVEINTWLGNREDYDEDGEEEYTNSQDGEEEASADNQPSDNQSSKEEGDDGEEEASADNQSSKEEGEEGEVDAEMNSGKDDIISETDDAQRNNESNLLDTNRDGTQTAYCNGITDEIMSHAVTNYKELKKQRDAQEIARKIYNGSHFKGIYNNPEISNHYEEFKNSSSKTVNAMVREFERKKAAFEYSRSQTAKKGSLNVNKIHQYQYSEDIFQTVTQLAESKSHGIVVNIDWSGSMSGIVIEVVQQALILAMFCKRVNIPFEFYTFTSRSRSNDYVEKVGDFYSARGLKIVEVLNGTINKKEYEIAALGLYSSAVVYGYRYIDKYNLDCNLYDLCELDGFGGTPLIEATVCMNKIIKKFQHKHSIQNSNYICLTDGDASSIDLVKDYNSAVDVDSSKVVVDMDGILVKGSDTFDLYSNAVKELCKQTGATSMCLFLATNKREFITGLHLQGADHFDNVFVTESYSKFNNDNVYAKPNSQGYDQWIIVKVGSHVEEEFVVKENKNGKDIAIKDIKKQFRKFSKNSNNNKKLVTTITDTLAA